MKLITSFGWRARRHGFCGSRVARIIVIGLFIGYLGLLTYAGGTAAQAAQRPLIVAHYMPWFVAKPSSPVWGWHWTMNAFDPERITDGKRQIASHYYPLIGPYDSGDPAVIEYHLLLMKLAGIDGIIVDWYGLSDLYDYPVVHQNTLSLFKQAAKISMKVGICYEDQTIQQLVKAGKLAADERVAHVKREVEWMRQHWFSAPVYLKLNNKPVLLSFGSSGLTDTEWEQVLAPQADPLLYLSEHKRRSVAAGTFDWPQPQLGLAGVDRYYQSMQPVQVSVPTVFPRFHDIYKEGKAQEGYPQISDDGGQTFAVTFERAWKSGVPLVQIATWNDWGEGTGIEPTQEFGYRDLETIQRLRRTGGSPIAATPEDLRLPYRLWVLRGLQAHPPQLAAALDKAARQLAAGDIPGARQSLRHAGHMAHLDHRN